MSTTWQEHIARHTTTALEAVRSVVKSGDFLVFGHAVAAPSSLSKALYDDRERLTDVKAFHMLYFAEP
ncbi:MAG: 4-hydroxybutyrate CoA-transferase, partial [Porphyromonas sp.]|nr:4-hydroxybutyrate CoA-transferase [Porphyromonas sp.]